MKMKKITLSLMAGAMMLASAVGAFGINHNDQMRSASAEAGITTYGADVAGGINVTYTAATNTNFDWVNAFLANQTTSGSGIYIRMRNNTGIETPITISLADGGGALWTIGTADLTYSLFDSEGKTETTKTYLYTTNIQLPVYFDGIVYLPFANYTVDAWGTGKTNTLSSLVWMIKFGIQPAYNSFANYTIGDIFNASGLNTDVSALPADFSANFGTEITSDGGVTLARALSTDFNPSGKDLLGGNVISTNNLATINEGPRADLADAAQSIYGSGFFMRAANYGNDVWPMLEVTGCTGGNSTPSSDGYFYYYNLDATSKTTYTCNAYNGFYLPSSFDGFIYVPLSSLHLIAGTEARFDWIYGIFVTVDALAFPNAHVVFGDVFSHANTMRDGSSTTHSSFASLRNTNLTSGKVTHNPGFSDDLATAFASLFLEYTYPCDTAAATNWNDLSGEYSSLTSDDKALLVNAIYSGKTEAQKSDIDKAMERYDLAVDRQGLTNFIGRETLSSRNSLSINQNDNLIIVVASLVALVGVSILFFLKKKKYLVK